MIILRSRRLQLLSPQMPKSIKHFEVHQRGMYIISTCCCCRICIHPCKSTLFSFAMFSACKYSSMLYSYRYSYTTLSMHPPDDATCKQHAEPLLLCVCTMRHYKAVVAYCEIYCCTFVHSHCLWCTMYRQILKFRNFRKSNIIFLWQIIFRCSVCAGRTDDVCTCSFGEGQQRPISDDWSGQRGQVDLKSN